MGTFVLQQNFKTVSSSSDHKLNNPVWYSLSETHEAVAINYEGIKFYQPDYCPFGGFDKSAAISAYLDEYAAMLDDFYIIGEKPEISDQLQIQKEVVCLQMIIDKPIAIEKSDGINELGKDYAEAVFELVNMVQPGYIKRKTILLGNYYGIFKNDELVAVTGERMKMNNYTEVSAVCTLPGHTGKGYASQLLAHTVDKIFSENKTPYLHVAETNTGASKLYEKLGFTIRRKISAWNIVKQSNYQH